MGAVGVHGGRVLAARLAHQLPEAVAQVLHLAGAQHAAHPQQLRVLQPPRRVPAAPRVPGAMPQDEAVDVLGGQVGTVPGSVARGELRALPRDERFVPGNRAGTVPGGEPGSVPQGELRGMARDKRSGPRAAGGLRQGRGLRSRVVPKERGWGGSPVWGLPAREQ